VCADWRLAMDNIPIFLTSDFAADYSSNDYSNQYWGRRQPQYVPYMYPAYMDEGRHAESSIGCAPRQPSLPRQRASQMRHVLLSRTILTCSLIGQADVFKFLRAIFLIRPNLSGAGASSMAFNLVLIACDLFCRNVFVKVQTSSN
jgi:hypothetical protein